MVQPRTTVPVRGAPSLGPITYEEFLVVEIVSPSSGPRDRGDKFYEYEAGGVPEYWLVDPAREQLEVYRLKEGRYRSVRPDDEGVVYSEAMPGFWLKEAWLWQDPLPRVLNVLKKWSLL